MTRLTFVPSNALTPNKNISLPSGMKGYFSREECARIVQLSTALPEMEGHIEANRNMVVDEQFRRSNIQWINPGPETLWIFDKVSAAVAEVNKVYQYDLAGYRSAQIARYETDGHYTWHTDLGAGGMSNRKLSVSVQLSDPNDYDGGELEFMTVGGIQANPPKDQGTVIIFPTFVPHRVAPVTRGVRWSMVTWIYGPPFR
jgi:PKHD-type hydroxylase